MYVYIYIYIYTHTECIYGIRFSHTGYMWLFFRSSRFRQLVKYGQNWWFHMISFHLYRNPSREIWLTMQFFSSTANWDVFLLIAPGPHKSNARARHLIPATASEVGNCQMGDEGTKGKLHKRKRYKSRSIEHCSLWIGRFEHVLCEFGTQTWPRSAHLIHQLLHMSNI